MSINKLGDFDDATYTLECDRCGNEAEETFSAFYDAVTWNWILSIWSWILSI